MGKHNKHCDVCGTKMVRFLNPERWICPSPNKHAALDKVIHHHGKATGQVRNPWGKKGKPQPEDN